MHQFMYDNSEIHASGSDGDYLPPSGSAYCRIAAVVRRDKDVIAFVRSWNESNASPFRVFFQRRGDTWSTKRRILGRYGIWNATGRPRLPAIANGASEDAASLVRVQLWLMLRLLQNRPSVHADDIAFESIPSIKHIVQSIVRLEPRIAMLPNMHSGVPGTFEIFRCQLDFDIRLGFVEVLKWFWV